MKAILAPCALALLLGFPAEALNAAQTPPICRGKDLTQLASFASSRAKRADGLLNADGSRPADAHAVLAPALEGFAPTPEMPEIAEAQALLAALGRETPLPSGPSGEGQG